MRDNQKLFNTIIFCFIFGFLLTWTSHLIVRTDPKFAMATPILTSSMKSFVDRSPPSPNEVSGFPFGYIIVIEEDDLVSLSGVEIQPPEILGFPINGKFIWYKFLLNWLTYSSLAGLLFTLKNKLRLKH